MNKQTSDRLFQYRKANGYSQEELASKIGVSRQAISKWERGKSSPDTDNLIALAKLYKITIDELINGDDIENTADKNIPPENDNTKSTKVSFRNGIHVRSENDKVDISFSGIHVETKNGETVHIGSSGVETEGIDEEYIFKRQPSWTQAICPTVIIITYLIIGFTFENGWSHGWLLIFLIPIIESFIAAVKTKNPSAFAYPVFVVAMYLTIGMLISIWHPTWIIFLTIPIFYAIADTIKQKGKNNNAE